MKRCICIGPCFRWENRPVRCGIHFSKQNTKGTNTLSKSSLLSRGAAAECSPDRSPGVCEQVDGGQFDSKATDIVTRYTSQRLTLESDLLTRSMWGEMAYRSGGDSIRVTTDGKVFEFSADNHQLFSPGGEVSDFFHVDSPPRRVAAVASHGCCGGEPTSWSAAIDGLAAGRTFDATTQGLVFLEPAEQQNHRLSSAPAM